MLHYFNPGHETAVLNTSPYYVPSANQLKMQQDLAYLPAWYAHSEDLIFVENELTEEFAGSVSHFTQLLPKAISLKNLSENKDILFNQELAPWGISPHSIQKFEKIKSDYRQDLLIPEWDNIIKELCGRQTAQRCLKYLAEQVTEIRHDIIPLFHQDIPSIEKVLKSSPHPLLAKMPYSSSGRGLLWLSSDSLTPKEYQILNGALKKQGSISTEKALNKKTDFAMQFISDGMGNITYKGFSLFETNAKGSYLGNYLMSQKKIESIIFSSIDPAIIDQVRQSLIVFLSKEFAHIYKGCIGIDMMIYQENEYYYLHPCVEINMRYNMGYLSLQLHQHFIEKESEGRFYIDFDPSPSKTYLKHKDLEQKYPAVFTDNRIQSGYIPLCPVTNNSKYTAYIILELRIKN